MFVVGHLDNLASMKSLPGLFLLGFVVTSWAQVQLSGEPDQGITSRQETPWIPSGVLAKKARQKMSEESLRLLEAAAAANDTNALMQLAAMAASDTDALGYVRRAAELGDHDAEYELAAMYAQGRGTAKDMKTAILWGRKAAEAGNRMAQVALGTSLLEGAAEDPSMRSEGIVWIEKASSAGYNPAAITLAKIYALGEFGIPVDESKAEAVLKSLAESNDADCQFALASLYHQGKSYGAQRGLAIVWLKRAKENGHPEAGKILKEIEREKASSSAK